MMVEVLSSIKPVRFVAVLSLEYLSLGLNGMEEITDFPSQHFRIELSRKKNIFLPGITVLMWSGLDSNNTAIGKYSIPHHTFDLRDCQLVVDTYRFGYGSRGRCLCQGCSLYNAPCKKKKWKIVSPFIQQENIWKSVPIFVQDIVTCKIVLWLNQNSK